MKVMWSTYEIVIVKITNNNFNSIFINTPHSFVLIIGYYVSPQSPKLLPVNSSSCFILNLELPVSNGKFLLLPEQMKIAGYDLKVPCNVLGVLAQLCNNSIC